VKILIPYSIGKMLKLTHADIHKLSVDFVRRVSTVGSANQFGPNNEISTHLYNHNPRNLERLRIARKPQGYALDDVPTNFWNRIIISQTNRHSTAYVEHHTGKRIISASTKEWAIKKFLKSNLDMEAMETIGRVLAQRCLECGLLELHSSYEAETSSPKVQTLLKGLKEAGISLKESECFHPHQHWSREAKEKPWEVHE